VTLPTDSRAGNAGFRGTYAGKASNWPQGRPVSASRCRRPLRACGPPWPTRSYPPKVQFPTLSTVRAGSLRQR